MSTRAERNIRRADLVKRLTELAPGKRADGLLEEVDGKALVSSIAAEDVYATIIDVGLADCTDIVQLSTPEQFRTYVDLASWQRDRVDPLEVLRWLRAARGDDDEGFIQKLLSLDIEVVELLFKRLTRIHDLVEDPDVNTEGVTMETPEGKFLVELTIEGVDEAALRRLIFDLMAHNPFELTRFLEAIRHDLDTELEETAYQFRKARLEDLGFPTLEEAHKIFAWVDPDKYEAPKQEAGLTTAAQGRVDYVGASLQALDAGERQNLELEVRYLVHCVLLAEGAEPGDPPALRRASEQARDTLDLGFEHLTGGDPVLAVDVVRARPLKEIFQVGSSLSMRLKRQVERLAKDEGARFGDTWLALDEEAAAMAALLRRRPLKTLKVPGAEPVPFRSRRELAESAAVVARVRQQKAVFTALLGTSPADVVKRFGVSLADLTPQRLFLAVVARAEVDDVLDVAPFPAMRLTELWTRSFDEGPPVKLRASAGQRALKVLEGKLTEGTPELKVMIERVLTALLQDVGATWAKDGRVDASKLLTLPVTGELPL